MESTACEGVAAAADPGTTRRGSGCGVAQPAGEEGGPGFGVQEWADGSTYEGGFLDGLKHGRGRYTWKNGEYYEGFFYKDFKHGDALYCWPTGHKFTGKFYLNRREGYGDLTFPDGTTFQGLYHMDQRIGPGVLTYSDGRQDVGLWLGKCLLKLCTSAEDSFSLDNFPEYATFMQPSVTPGSQTQLHSVSSAFNTKTRTDFQVNMNGDLLIDESFILPPGIETHSTDGDHLPLPPGRRKELDKLFYGDLWEPDAHPYQGFKRDPFSTLPLEARMQAIIQKHRPLAENAGWNVAAVLSMNRESFGPKGPLEASSERLIRSSLRGDFQAVSQLLRGGLVHPDVADSRGHTALTAATVNCHNDVIHLLLDMGVDIDKLNSDGMSALAVCHVLYYPFHSLYTAWMETPSKSPVLIPSSESSPQISQSDFTSATPGFTSRSQTADTNGKIQTDDRFSEQTPKELTEHMLDNSSENIPADNEHLQEEERKEEEGEDGDCEDGEDGDCEDGDCEDGEDGDCEDGEDGDCEDAEQVGDEQSIRGDDNKSDEEERQIRSTCKEAMENGKRETDVEDELKKEEDNEVECSSTETGARKMKMEENDEVEEDVESSSEMDEEKTGQTNEFTPKPSLDSACSVSSLSILAAEENLRLADDAQSHTGGPQGCGSQETARKAAALKIPPRVRLRTLNLLLERGADPNLTRVPMPVLFFAIMAGDADAVRKLLLSGARADVPLPTEKKGLYPLHVAAALPGPEGSIITEFLLHCAIDPDVQACDQDEIYEPDRKSVTAEEPPRNPELKEGGRTALHIACQRNTDYMNACKVVALLLSHRASTNLLWSGHSPLSLAIASGNELAVEELLNRGADPNLPLGFRVGSALCALVNTSYQLRGNKLKLLDMLAKAGADILMPVTVGGVVGTAVDYAHYSFNQDSRTAPTLLYGLNTSERETVKARLSLLRVMTDLLRQTASRTTKKKNLERQQQQQLTLNRADDLCSNAPTRSREELSETAEKHGEPRLKFCYHCGRSASVKLTACARCCKVFFCSETCRFKGLNEGHREECVQVSVSADGIQKSVAFESQRAPRPKTVAPPPNVTVTPLNVTVTPLNVPLKPVRMTDADLENPVNLKENYSCN